MNFYGDMIKGFHSLGKHFVALSILDSNVLSLVEIN